MSNELHVEVLSDYERDVFLARLTHSYLGKPTPRAHEKMVISGVELSGVYELTARDAVSGEVAWCVEQSNLLTDVARQAFFEGGLQNVRFGFMPSTETPNVLRCSVPTDGSQCFASGNLGNGTVTPSTFTKQWSTTFGVPAANRTLGSVFSTFYTGYDPAANLGVPYIWSYSLLTPPKTQTTVQTLEVVYKLSANPIY